MKKCPYCNQQIEVKVTDNKDEFRFISHRRRKDSFFDEDASEECVHQKNIIDVPCEGSGKIDKTLGDDSISSMISHRTLTD